MTPPPEEVAFPNYPNGFQLSENQLKKHRQSYFTFLLLTLESENVDKKIHYKLIYLLRSLVKQYPYLIIHPAMFQITCGCIKIILEKSQLQHNFVDEQFSSTISQLKPEYLQKLELIIYSINVHNSQLPVSPYEILNQIEIQQHMNQQISMAIKKCIDYALILPQTYSSSSFDVLYACIQIYATHNSEAYAYLQQLQEDISTNVDQLYQLITVNLKKDISNEDIVQEL